MYGTLAPGELNHHELSVLGGSWSVGVVHGRLVEAGWGADLGFPGLVLDASASTVQVQMLSSPDLAAHLERLDLFEGTGYRREVTDVVDADGETVEAWIYVLA